MMSYFKFLTVTAIAFLLTACTPPTVPDPEPTDTTYGDEAGATTDGMGTQGPYNGEVINDPTAGELPMVIYFDFDSSEVRVQDQDIVSRHAMQLGNHPGAHVRLEGHTDERGSREYNIGLGERRAQAVRRILLLQGVSPEQIATVSFGEERPAAFGSTESDYAQNRRVEFKYDN